MLHFWNRFRAHLRRGAAAYLVLAVALLPSAIAYDRVRRNAQAQEQERFRNRAQETADAVQDNLRQYEAAFSAVSGLFEASREVTPDEWTRFTDSLHLASRYPGIRSIGWAPLVRAEDLGVFTMRLTGILGTNLPLQTSTEEFLVPTVYIQQYNGANDRRYGWDAMNDAPRRAALQRMIQDRKPVISFQPNFTADDEPLPGLITYVPVTAGPEVGKETPGQADKGSSSPSLPNSPHPPVPIQGTVFSSFIPQRLLRGLNKTQLDPALYVELLLGQTPDNKLQVEGSRLQVGRGPSGAKPSTPANAQASGRAQAPLAQSGADAPPPHPQFAATHTVTLVGEPFLLRVLTTPEFEAQTQTFLPRMVLVGGILCSLLLFGIAWTQVHARAAAENLNRRLLASEEQLLRSNRELERHIEEQQLTETLLAHERDLLSTLLDHSPDRIYFKDRDSRFLKCGKAVIARLGMKDTSEAIGKTDFDFFTEGHARAAFEMEQQIMRSGQAIVGIVEKETWSDGHESWVLTSKMPLRDKHGHIIGTFGTSKDITSLKNAEVELEKEKELLAVTLRSIGDGVITTDTAGHIVLFNKVAEQLTGWSQEEAAGTPLREVFRTLTLEERESDTAMVRRAMKDGEVVAQERASVLVARDGTERNVAESVAPIVDHDGKTIGAVLVFRDITEKLKTEAERMRSNKLESIGVLAGGIAHDFNNILTVILGNISLARMLDETLPPQISHVLNEAEKASLRARDLTQRLLTFAKGGAPIKKIVTLGPLLRDCTKAALQGSVVNYQFFFAEDLWTVNADEAQLAQVFQNLIHNARHAVSATPVIDVHANNIDMASDPLMFLIPGRYVRISIRDHGTGLQPEQLSKIFDPYFSSKKQGGGLELATAYSIIRKHEGQIRVESISGQGTVFHVYLPAATVAAKDEPKGQRRARRIVGGRILVMDDEPSIRQLASILLQRIGYTAVAVADGAEAVTKYDAARRAGQPFDAVVMDLTVPNGMGGADAILELRKLDPDVKAIVSSGYSNDPVMANYRDHGFSGVVPKPYNAEDLALALSELLAVERLPREPAGAG